MCSLSEMVGSIFLRRIDIKNVLNYSEYVMMRKSDFVRYVKSNKYEKEGYMTWGDKIDGIVEDAVAEAVISKTVIIKR